MTTAPRYPGIRVTANGNQLVSYHAETPIADAGVFYPITPSTELGMIDLGNPVLLGPVQNQENYMHGVAARRNNFSEPIAQFLEEAYADFGKLTGRYYGMLSAYKTDDADTVFVSLGSAAENIGDVQRGVLQSAVRYTGRHLPWPLPR